jgi:hypothetical protein
MVRMTLIIIITKTTTTSNDGGDWIHSKLLGQYLNNIPGKHEIKEL